MKKLIELRKKSNGHLILALHLEELFAWPKYLLKSLVSPFVYGLTTIFETLDQVSRHHTALLLLAALGLGFGMSLPIFASPDLSWAETTASSSSVELSISQIRFDSLDKSMAVVAADDKNFMPSHQVGYQLSTHPLVIQGEWHSTLSEFLPELTLGSRITLLAENGGRYHFGVVELRQLKAKELSTLLSTESQQLLLVVPTDLTQQSLLVIVAQRQTI